MNAATTMPRRLLTAEEAATYLGIKLNTIQKWTCRHRLPVVRLSRRAVRYDIRDLDRLIESRKDPVEPPPGPEETASRILRELGL